MFLPVVILVAVSLILLGFSMQEYHKYLPLLIKTYRSAFVSTAPGGNQALCAWSGPDCGR